MTALDTIEVDVEHGGEVLTLDVEITAWPTRAPERAPESNTAVTYLVLELKQAREEAEELRMQLQAEKERR